MVFVSCRTLVSLICRSCGCTAELVSDDDDDFAMSVEVAVVGPCSVKSTSIDGSTVCTQFSSVTEFMFHAILS